MVTPQLVDVIEKPSLKYKKYSFKEMEVEKYVDFSRLPIDVVYIEDVSIYIHTMINEIDHMKFE